MNNEGVKYNTSTNLMTFPGNWLDTFLYPEYTRFYMVMSEIMLDDNKYNSFINSLTSLEKIKSNPDLVSD